MTEKEAVERIRKEVCNGDVYGYNEKDSWKGRISMTEMQIWLRDIILECILIMWSIVKLVTKIINIIRSMDRSVIEAIAKEK